MHAVLDIFPLEKPVDEYYGTIRALLNQAGKPIGGNDLLIAAHAFALNLTLVSANVREFSRIPDLRVKNWLENNLYQTKQWQHQHLSTLILLPKSKISDR